MVTSAMRRIIFRSLALLSVVSLTGNSTPRGVYARAAQPIWGHIASAGDRPLMLRSPDKATIVSVRYTELKNGDSNVTLDVSGRIGPGRVRLGPGVGSELLWAPDSRAFAVTTSDQGANGQFRTVIVADSVNGLAVRDVSRLIVRAFGHPVKCGWPEEPNVAAVQWLAGSRQLVVVAEIIGHSNCDSFGTFRAYEVDWRSMRVVRSYDQLTAKRLFGAAMGPELRSASDQCILRPRSCWVSTNHPSARR